MSVVADEETFSDLPYDPDKDEHYAILAPYWQGVLKDVHDVSACCPKAGQN